jgi:hypothetical protein
MFRELMNRTILVAVFLPLVALAQEDLWDDDDWGDEEKASRWSGFLEAGLGTRLSRDPQIAGRNTLEELRGRIESDWTISKAVLALKADGGYDGIERQGFGELRDLTISLTVGRSLDVKIGHQVQTWGTGDLVFLNDLFPKDFVSFFAGRDDEYLKAPGSAIRLTRFASLFNVDFVWTPVFEPDNYLTGERFSFFSPLAGTNVAPSPPLSAIEPDRSLKNGEFALRVFRTIDGREYALYGYRGFSKQPSALTENMQATFSPLSVYGASLRRPAGPGLLNGEVAWYDSRDDRDGTDSLTPNSQVRVLAGFEWEAARNFTVGLQYYVEWTLDHDELIATSPSPQFLPDEFRQLLTNRLTYRTGRDRYIWSLFTFLSPTDRDIYLRPQATLRYSDSWTLSVGANLFAGSDNHTFFGQFEDASNAYVRFRYNY